jgi:hypothetical protein
MNSVIVGDKTNMCGNIYKGGADFGLCNQETEA